MGTKLQSANREGNWDRMFGQLQEGSIVTAGTLVCISYSLVSVVNHKLYAKVVIELSHRNTHGLAETD